MAMGKRNREAQQVFWIPTEKIPDEDAESIQTISDAIAYIDGKLKN